MIIFTFYEEICETLFFQSKLAFRKLGKYWGEKVFCIYWVIDAFGESQLKLISLLYLSV